MARMPRWQWCSGEGHDLLLVDGLRWAQMGLAWACGWAGRSGSGFRARPSRIGYVFLVFFNLFSMRKQFQRSHEIFLRHEKYF
jgi:hypothetical protein